LSEILYAYSSAWATTAVPSPASANTPWYNTTLGIAMLFGRFLMIVPIMALAGSLAAKEIVPLARARSRFRRHVRHPAARHGAAGRRAEFSPGA
jgi:K+-transporting ATPase A subunit